jgi:hypothetical protein
MRSKFHQKWDIRDYWDNGQKKPIGGGGIKTFSVSRGVPTRKVSEFWTNFLVKTKWTEILGNIGIKQTMPRI